jgi:hypothetical protein
MLAPSRANRNAMARPIPRLAPVMMMVLFDKSPMTRSLFFNLLQTYTD